MKSVRCKTAAIATATLAISVLIGTGISEAMRLTSGNRAGGMRATAIRAKSFGKKSIHMSSNKARLKPARVVGAQSVARARDHTLQWLPLLGEIGHVGDHFYGRDTLRATREVRGNYFQVLPIHDPGRTIQWPSERMSDPSDIPRWEDLEHFPGRDMINSKYLGGPDREYDYERDWHWGSYWDYLNRNRLSDISHASCLWDAATIQKMFHWGGPGSPILDNDTNAGNWRCGPWDDKGGKDNGSGGTDTSGSESGKKDNTKATKEFVKEEAKVVKDDDGKKGDNGGTGTEGDDPDELRSPIAQEMQDINVDMLFEYGSGGRTSANSAVFPMPRTGSNNTPVGLAGTQQRIGPGHENRPDVTPSSVSGLAISSQMSYAESPTPDGGSNPPPGPEYNPVASTTSSGVGSATANRMGYVSSPAIGDDGGKVGPLPGPK